MRASSALLCRKILSVFLPRLSPPRDGPQCPIMPVAGARPPLLNAPHPPGTHNPAHPYEHGTGLLQRKANGRSSEVASLAARMVPDMDFKSLLAGAPLSSALLARSMVPQVARSTNEREHRRCLPVAAPTSEVEDPTLRPPLRARPHPPPRATHSLARKCADGEDRSVFV